jgi:putative ABC transport system permease protein
MLCALREGDREEYLRRVGVRLVEGALPATGSDGAAIHRDVAKARSLRIGSRFGRLADPKDQTPGSFTVTGIVDGPSRVGVVDLDYTKAPKFVLAQIPPLRIVYAKEGRKRACDAALNAAKDPDGNLAFRVWDEAFFRQRTEELLANVPLILNAIVGAITVIISIVVVLLAVIAFQARADEFGLLLAVGLSRRRLVRKVVVESLLAAVAAWALGLGIGYGFVALYERLVLAPKAIRIDLFGTYPILLASALPFVASAVSALVLARRLARLDPVAILQRRNA